METPILLARIARWTDCDLQRPQRSVSRQLPSVLFGTSPRSSSAMAPCGGPRIRILGSREERRRASTVVRGTEHDRPCGTPCITPDCRRIAGLPDSEIYSLCTRRGTADCILEYTSRSPRG